MPNTIAMSPFVCLVTKVGTETERLLRLVNSIMRDNLVLGLTPAIGLTRAKTKQGLRALLAVSRVFVFVKS